MEGAVNAEQLHAFEDGLDDQRREAALFKAERVMGEGGVWGAKEALDKDRQRQREDDAAIPFEFAVICTVFAFVSVVLECVELCICACVCGCIRIYV